MHRSRFAEGREVTLAICLRQGDVIGAISLVMDEGRSDVGKLGYWIGRPFWNRGYATEAAAAIVRYAFATQGLLRVEACHFLWNRASGRVMEKIGMRREGECRRFVPKWSREEVCVFYAIDRAEWVRGASPSASPSPDGGEALDPSSAGDREGARSGSTKKTHPS